MLQDWHASENQRGTQREVKSVRTHECGMMIGVPYNPIIGEMSVDGGDDDAARCHVGGWGAVARRSKCTRPRGESG